MVSMDRERVEDEAVALLTELSLTEYEARTYVGLLRLGRGSARQVSDVVEVPRSRVYDAVESLHDAGLVDIRYGTPKEFIPVSDETTIRKFSVKYEDLIDELADVLQELTPTHMRTEQLGVWTVTGSENITRRIIEFVDLASENIVYFCNGNLVTDELAAALNSADERGLLVSVGSIGEADGGLAQLEHLFPDAPVDDQLSPWAKSQVTRLLMINDEITLVSVQQGARDVDRQEVAIWGRGSKNNLVVVLRTLFDIQFDDEIEALDPDANSIASAAEEETE